MNSYLLVYNRRTGALDVKEFAGPEGRSAALRSRIATERLQNRDEVEVVVIAADSPAELRRTHSRYFETVGSLARSAGGRLHKSAI